MSNGYLRYVHPFDLRHPGEMGDNEVESFLTHLAVEGRVVNAIRGEIKSHLDDL